MSKTGDDFGEERTMDEGEIVQRKLEEKKAEILRRDSVLREMEEKMAEWASQEDTVAADQRKAATVYVSQKQFRNEFHAFLYAITTVRSSSCSASLALFSRFCLHRSDAILFSCVLSCYLLSLFSVVIPCHHHC